MKAKLADRVAFAVGPDRYASGRQLEAKENFDVFLLDDGFQHLSLARKVDIVLIDSTRPLHEDWLLPAGRLREPISALSRADVVLFTRVQQAPGVRQAMRRFPALPIYRSSTRLVAVRPVTCAPGAASTCDIAEPVFVFCAIGNPEAFLTDLVRWGIKVAGKLFFRDHHIYALSDMRKLNDLAKRSGAAALITTEKDLQNLGEFRPELPLYCCEVAIEIPDQEEFWGKVRALVSATPEVDP